MRSLLVLCLLILSAIPAWAQNTLPDVKIRNLAGKEVSFTSISASKDTAIVFSFWATWCIPCITEMEILNDQYAEKQKEIPFKIVAISIDDARTVSKVKPFVRGRGWDFEFYTDTNHDLKRALNINDIPHILIIKNGSIVYQHTGYTPGNEEELYAKLKKDTL
jgi:thiol-disulfide isomerase/thioredoxin